MSTISIREDLGSLLTEQRNSATFEIDTLDTAGILRTINNEDKSVAVAVEKEISYIASAVELVVESMNRGGRLIYLGAGTSGRLGVLDAAECPPTFGTDPSRIIGVIAGGDEALRSSIEGAEDDEAKGVRDIDALLPLPVDVVCGLAASRRTPYVVAAITRSRKLGAKTVFITTNPRSTFNMDVDVAICPNVGPEVIMGSTRMKSGTAQKMVLNMITTAVMIRMGKIYENMMVDLQLTSKKLVERARRILTIAGGVDYETACQVLDQAGGHVKTALVMISAGIGATEARQRLERSGGFVRGAIGGG